MGLDMYLVKKTYIGAHWEHRNVTGVIDIKICGVPTEIDFKRVDTIVESVGYWRKANAIHNWFVENVQDGKDDCKEYYVSRNKMKELLDTCKTILANTETTVVKIRNGYTFDEQGAKIYNYEEGLIIEDDTTARELLPTTEGFFFGSTDYDEYYLQDIKDTIEILEEVLKDEEGDYYYSSSW